MKNKILITGGLGNLGSWITQHFIDLGFEVDVLTKNPREVNISGKYKIIYADISNFSDLQKNDAAYDYVVHLASVNDGFVDDYFQFSCDINVKGTRNILEWVKTKKIKHFIYFSTFQVYGKYSGNISENTTTNPINDYGSTHLMAETFIQQFYRTHDLPFTIFRLTNSYGCPKDLNSSKWYLILNDLSKTAFENKKIILKSNGKALRDFIWMGDVCEVVENTLNNAPKQEIYNISGNRSLSMLDVAKSVKDAYWENYKVDIPIEVNQNDKTEHAQDLLVSNKKLIDFLSINIDIKNRMKSEAKNIFSLLENQKKN